MGIMANNMETTTMFFYRGYIGFMQKSHKLKASKQQSHKPSALNPTWTPKVCKIMAFRAVIMGLGLLFYILLGFR